MVRSLTAGLLAIFFSLPATLVENLAQFETELMALNRSLEQKSPLITHIEWGKTDVEGLGSVKDAKLWPGGAREWDWGEDGTRHMSGITRKAVQELIERKATILILSRGVDLILQVPDALVQELRNLGLEVIVLQSYDAVKKYNELAQQGKPVGALIHSTC